MLKIFSKLIAITALSFTLFGCALTPKDSKAAAQSDILLSTQLNIIDENLKKVSPGKRSVIYIGSAQHSQSLVFQRDILLAQRKFLEINPNVQSILLSNQLESNQLNYPFATQSTLDTVFKKVGDWSQKYPINLIILISTHGNVDILSINIANTYWPAIRSSHIKKWLEGLHDVPSAMLLSACFSGSFIQPLADENRIILTAAAYNRNSFGCAYHDENTYFIGNLFSTDWNSKNTWEENYRQMNEKIQQTEKKLGLPNSSPQIYLANSLKNQEVFNLINGFLNK